MLESLFNKAAGLRSGTLVKKRLQHRCFPVSITKFLRIPIFENICEWLSLYFRIYKKKFLKNEKMANQKLGKVGNLGNLGIIIPSFLFPSFRFCPTAKIENLD